MLPTADLSKNFCPFAWHCKKNKAKLVVAKLDRLSRNVSFLLKLIDSGVDVLFADLPELNGAMGRFMLTTMASVAELEAGLISERTKAALKAAKARGVKLGSHGAEVLAPQYRKGRRPAVLRSWQQLGNASGSERDGAREESLSAKRDLRLSLSPVSCVGVGLRAGN